MGGLVERVVVRPAISRKKLVKCNKCLRGGYGDKSCPVGGHVKSAKIGCYEGKEKKKMTEYMENAQGALVPINNVKPIDKLRDDVVRGLVDKAKEASARLSKFKLDAMSDINEFISISAEEYGVKFGGRKGNVTLMSYDGKFKLQVANADNINFDERLQIAKGLIDECIHEWAENSNDNIKTLVNHAFQTDKQGKVSTSKVLGLRRLNIKDEKWLKAMQAITDSINVYSSKSYLRIYERVANTDQFKPIPLDTASL